MNLARAWTLASLIVVASWHPAPARAQSAAFSKERVTFKSGGLTLVGFVFKPDGSGPFPGLVWNHGSEKSPGTMRQFDAVAAIFVPAGYVVFAPMRRGHGDSEGPYVMDQLRRGQDSHASASLAVRLMEGEHLDDQLAGQAYLQRLPYVDPQRLVVAGCSFGGIQTLLGAERGAGYRAAVAISPGALSWNGNPLLRERLVAAVRKAEIPVFLIQPPKDASLEPSRVLGAELERRGKQNAVKVYPPDMPQDEQGHCFGGARGMHVWAHDVLAFFSGALR